MTVPNNQANNKTVSNNHKPVKNNNNNKTTKINLIKTDIQN